MTIRMKVLLYRMMTELFMPDRFPIWTSGILLRSILRRRKQKKAMQLLHEAYTGAPLIMKNVEVPVGFAEQLKNMRSGLITVVDHGDKVRIETMNIVFRFPQDDEISAD